MTVIVSPITELPTTAGSIVRFTGWADLGETEPFEHVVTLLPSVITAQEEFEGLIWGNAFITEDPTVYTEAEILAGSPRLLHEAPAPNFNEPFELEASYGTIVAVGDTIAVYTPGCLDGDEIAEADWVNGEGAWFDYDTIQEFSRVIVPGASTL